MRAWAAVVMLLAGCGDNLAGPPEGVLFEGKVWGGNLAVADGMVYFSTYGERDGHDHALWRVPRDGGFAEPIWVGPLDIFGYGLAIDRGTIYWSEHHPSGTPGVFAVNTKGGTERELARFDDESAAYGNVVIDGDFLYAASFSEVLEIPLAGGAARTVASGKLRWMDHRGGVLYTLTEGGGVYADSTKLASVDSAGSEFAVDDHALYVGDGKNLVIVPLDGSPAQRVPQVGTPTSLVVHDDAVYMILELKPGTGDEELDRYGLTTGGTRTLATDLQFAFSIAVDDSAVFVAQCACSTRGFIERIDL